MYFTGNETGGYTIDEILNSENWLSISSPSEIPDNYTCNYLWIKTVLPEWNGTNPALYIGQVCYGMSAYLNNDLIYRIENKKTSENSFIGWNKNIVQLPCFKKGDKLVMRINLGKEPLAVEGNILLSSYEEILKNIFTHNIGNIIFSVIFIFLGVVAYGLYLISRRQKLVLAIAVFLFPLGIFIAVNSPLFQALIKHPLLFYHLDYISLASAVAGGFYAIAQIVIQQYKKTVNILWKIHIAVLLLLIITINFTHITYRDVLKYFIVLITINMLLCIYLLTLSARKGNKENKILLAGMMGFSFSAILENILFFYFGLGSYFGYNVRVLHLGALVFVSTLIWIAYKNYVDSFRQKEIMRMKEMEAITRENETRQRFSAMLIESQENERNRISLELHDSIGQKLLLIKNQLALKIRHEKESGVAESLARINKLTGETIQEVRNISKNLRPQHLDQLGLTIAIETLIEEVEQNSEIEFRQHIGNIDKLFPRDKEINVYRIIQESLNNIIKHANASEASIEIEKTKDHVYIQIKDNGGGSRLAGKTKKGLGLTGMSERARIIGADLKIDFSETDGTTVSFKYQFDEHKNFNSR